MEERIIKGKALYTPKGAAYEYGRVGCNFYTGCPHGCLYCYLQRGVLKKQLGGIWVRLKKCFGSNAEALGVLGAEIKVNRDYLQKTGVFMSFTTDPLIPETIDMTISAMGMFVDNEIPVRLLTKNADFINNRRMELILRHDKEARKYVSFGFTLTGRDDMEPKASPNMKRVQTMGVLHSIGFKTFASLEPVIDWASTEKIFRLSLPTCDHYMLGLRSGVSKYYYKFIESGVAIERIIRMCESHGKTIYLKESVRKLLQKFYKPGAYEELLSHTVDMDGNLLNQ